MNPPIDYSLEVCDQCQFHYGFHAWFDLLACLRAANRELRKARGEAEELLRIAMEAA